VEGPDPVDRLVGGGASGGASCGGEGATTGRGRGQVTDGLVLVMPQQDGVEGIEIAPGVVFSDKLWSRLGDKTLSMERQKRRERMGNTDAVPNVPTAVFDHVFRNDNTWKQR
jgi:hypothetical protein